MTMAVKYDDSNIKHLSAMEHIRLRLGMYIGRASDGSDYDDGIYVLLKEVIDNAVDEFIMGSGRRVDVNVNWDTGLCTVRDYGRGIPLGKVVDCVSELNTGGKFNTESFQFSVGMNGVGTKAVNALSDEFYVRSVREGEFSEATFAKGKLLSKKRGKLKGDEADGTFVRFLPDATVFKKFRFREEHVMRRLKMYAYLNAGLVLTLNGEKVVSENGLADLIADEASFEKLYAPFHYRSKTLEFVFTHTNRFSETYYSFVNGQHTTEGGTHLTAFKEGLTKALNDYDPKKKFDGDDVRDGIIGAIAIRLQDPVFEGQAKTKLGSAEIRAELVADVKKAALEMFHRSPAETEKLIAKVEETAKLRSELNTVKKKARERSAAVSIRVPELKDCKEHLRLDRKGDKKGWGEDTMIFLTEGLSAGGTLTQCRDAVKQAVFFLRGKPLNTCGAKRDALYNNKEFFDLVKSLDIEESLERLRYGKIIFATDADVDGLHIRNLLITFFMRFFKKLVEDKRVFILETPLFRVRNKKEQYYCFTDEERETAIAKCGKTAEITRFKGLGELNAKEFKDFIGNDMRLTPVTCTDDFQLDKTIEFYMGSNSPERKDYIMENLVCDENSFE